MLAKKKKLSKKQIKEDKLVTGYYQFQNFYEANQSKIFIFAAALAVVVVAVFWYSSKVEQENLSAAIELSRVIPIYDQGSYLEAIDGQPGTNVLGLKKIVDQYGGSEQGEVARIYLANALYNTGKIDEAMEEYDNYSGSNDLLSASAMAGLAACHEAKGNSKEAADYYLSASEVDDANPQNADYLLSAAKNYLETGNSSKAKELLNEIKVEYKTSQAARNVDKYLAKTKI